MMHPARIAALAGVTLALLAASCGGRGAAASPTDLVYTPEIVGVITSWAPLDGTEGRYTLDSGDVIDLNVDGSADRVLTPNVSETSLHFPTTVAGPAGMPVDREVLLLVGFDDGSTWYAAAPAGHEAAAAGYEGCPFVMHDAGIYDEGDVLHFSTGLVLPKKYNFNSNVTGWRPDEAFPLRSADSLCIDRSGRAVSAWVWGPT